MPDKKIPEKLRVCVLMDRFSIPANVLLNKLVHNDDIEVVAVATKNIFAATKGKKKTSFVSSLATRARKMGYPLFCGLIIITILHFLPLLILDLLFLGFLFKNRYLLKSMPGLSLAHGFKVIDVNDINAKQTVRELKKVNADYFVSNYFGQIIDKEVIGIPKKGTINVHPAKLPKYKGVLYAFWALTKGFRRAAVTLHYIDSGVDTGPIISRKEFPIRKEDSYYRLARRSSTVSYELLQKFFAKKRYGKRIPAIEQKKLFKGRHWFLSLPKAKDYQQFAQRGKQLFRFRDLSISNDEK